MENNNSKIQHIETWEIQPRLSSVEYGCDYITKTSTEISNLGNQPYKWDKIKIRWKKMDELEDGK